MENTHHISSLSFSSTEKIKCIENLLNIEKKKSNNNNTLKLLIGTFSSDLTQEETNYLSQKYLIPEVNDEIAEPNSKKRRLN
tara:strand:+ start:4777 stop:5022 length:246 start_codon:yes stop_codon:yes gene_type:complete